MRVTAVWFHRNDYLVSTDSDSVSTLRTTLLKAVPQADSEIFSQGLDAFYSVTYGEACDAVKLAVVPVLFDEKNYIAAFAGVGASDGFSVASLVAVARRMGNAIRLLLSREDINGGAFQSHRLETRAVLTFTRRSLSEPDVVHGAFSECFVDCVFDTNKPKFITKRQQQRGNNNSSSGGGNNKQDEKGNNNSNNNKQDEDEKDDHCVQFWHSDPNAHNPIFEARWIRGAVLCGNYVINSFEDSSVLRTLQTTNSGWDGFLLLARAMSSFGCDRRLMENATQLESEMVQGEDTFRHLRIFRADVLHTVEKRADNVAAEKQKEEKERQKEEKEKLKQQQKTGVAGNEKSKTKESSPSSTSSGIPKEIIGGVQVSPRAPSHNCDVTAVTGELLRNLDELSKDIFSDTFSSSASSTASSSTATASEMHPELFAMLQNVSHRFVDAPQKYENFANAVNDSLCVDSLKQWGESNLSGSSILNSSATTSPAFSPLKKSSSPKKKEDDENEENQDGNEEEEKKSEEEKKQEEEEESNNNNINNKDRAAIHLRIRTPSELFERLGDNGQYWVSFKYIDFEQQREKCMMNTGGGAAGSASSSRAASSSPKRGGEKKDQEGRNGEEEEEQEAREYTGSNGFCIALFSWCLQYTPEDPSTQRPPDVKTTDGTFHPLLDEVVNRMVDSASETRALDSGIWSRVRSLRASEQYFENKSPHLLALDIINRSSLLESTNARILADEFTPDVIHSQQIPKLVRRSPVLESIDNAESEEEKFLQSQQQALLLSSSSSSSSSQEQEKEGQNNNNNKVVAATMKHLLPQRISSTSPRKQALLDWMDTFRRSVSRAHQMFASGSNEGSWSSSSEGAFFHGLYLVRRNLGGPANCPYAIVAAPTKYLSRLPYGCLVPTAANNNNSSTTSGAAQAGGGNNNQNKKGAGATATAAAGGGTKTGVSAATNVAIGREEDDTPLARYFPMNDAPLAAVLPPAPVDSLPLGLVEVHCMFTPNTDLDIMAAEMFHALMNEVLV